MISVSFHVLCVSHRPNVVCRRCGLALVIAIIFIMVFYAIMALSCVVRRISQEHRHLSDLHDALIQSLPVTVYRANDLEEGVDCAVYLSKLADGENARPLPAWDH